MHNWGGGSTEKNWKNLAIFYSAQYIGICTDIVKRGVFGQLVYGLT